MPWVSFVSVEKRKESEGKKTSITCGLNHA